MRGRRGETGDAAGTGARDAAGDTGRRPAATHRITATRSPKDAASRPAKGQVAGAKAVATSATQSEERAAARLAHLHYVNHRRPGITRHASGKSFRYTGPDGRPIADEAELSRIRSLAIPPAYTDVWICGDPNGHLQAVGRDARGRKQYRYHPRWRAVRDEAKYGHMMMFGQKLPLIRARVAHDLALHGLPRERVLATVVRLLETTLARIGNEEYARTNKSFGLTTLRHRHAEVHGAHVVFDFRAKHGIERHIDLADRKLANIIRRLEDLPGQELFQYEDEHGHLHHVNSHDVNAYLHEITGEDVTAKDFRTWAATNLAAVALRGLERFDSQAHAKKNLLRAVEGVAKMLGNTPAVCRKCYIHPGILDGYLDGSLLEGLQVRAEQALEGQAETLNAEEAAVMAFLSRRLTQAVAHPPHSVRAA